MTKRPQRVQSIAGFAPRRFGKLRERRASPSPSRPTLRACSWPMCCGVPPTSTRPPLSASGAWHSASSDEVVRSALVYTRSLVERRDTARHTVDDVGF